MTLFLVRSVLSEHCSSFNCTSNFRKVAKKIADSQTPMIRQTLSHPHQHQEISSARRAVESRSTWTTHFGQLFSLPSAVSGQVIPSGPLTSKQSRMFARNHLGQAWSETVSLAGLSIFHFGGHSTFQRLASILDTCIQYFFAIKRNKEIIRTRITGFLTIYLLMMENWLMHEYRGC